MKTVPLPGFALERDLAKLEIYTSKTLKSDWK